MNDSKRSTTQPLPMQVLPMQLTVMNDTLITCLILLLFATIQDSTAAALPNALLTQDNATETPTPASPEPSSTDLTNAYQQQAQRIAAKIAPSLVQIEIIGAASQLASIPSTKVTGVLIDSDGYLLTEASLFVQRPDTVLINTHQGKQQIAQVVAVDFIRQLALLKTAPIEQGSLITLADPSQVQVGQAVFAFGKAISPNAAHISKGIVSATGRIWGKAIQTDAKIGPLNYGGPLVDLQGRMLGILCPVSMNVDSMEEGKQWYDSGIGFAVTLDNYGESIETLKSGNDIYLGQTGIDFKQPNLNSMDFPIDSIHPGSPADLAGLKTGDKILKVKQQAVTCLADYYHATRTIDSRQSLTLTILSNDEERSVSLQLVSKLVPYRFPYFGFVATTNQQQQVEVTAVLPESPAVGKLQVNDQLIAVNQIAINTVDDLNKQISQAKLGQPVAISLQRDGSEETIAVELQAETLLTWLPTKSLVDQLKPAIPKPNRRQESVTSAGLSVDAILTFSAPTEPTMPPRPLVIVLADSLLTAEKTIKNWNRVAKDFDLDLLILSPQTKTWGEDDISCGLELIATAGRRFDVGQSIIAVIAQGNAGPVATELSLDNRLACNGLALIQANPSRSLLQFKNSPSLRKSFLILDKQEPEWVKLLRERFVPTAWLKTANQDAAWSDPQTLDIIASWVSGLRLQ